MTKNIYIIILLSFVNSFFVVAQNVKVDREAINEINNEIWFPFMESYYVKDAKIFNSLYTDDALRINSWSGIRLGKEYKKSIESSFMKSSSPPTKISFSFFERYQKDDIAFENGIYRVEVMSEKNKRITYSYFHVVLKKISGVWKIIEDYDSSNPFGKPIMEEDFLKGKILTKPDN